MPLILVIDDCVDNISVLSDLLESQGFRVQSVRDPALVFNQVFATQPDLILCDVMMPKLDGEMVTRMLKRVESTRTIPVLLCSALDESDLATRAVRCGADGYLRKAAAPREIVAAVRRGLARVHAVA